MWLKEKYRKDGRDWRRADRRRKEGRNRLKAINCFELCMAFSLRFTELIFIMCSFCWIGQYVLFWCHDFCIDTTKSNSVALITKMPRINATMHHIQTHTFLQGNLKYHADVKPSFWCCFLQTILLSGREMTFAAYCWQRLQKNQLHAILSFSILFCSLSSHLKKQQAPTKMEKEKIQTIKYTAVKRERKKNSWMHTQFTHKWKMLFINTHAHRFECEEFSVIYL